MHKLDFNLVTGFTNVPPVLFEAGNMLFEHGANIVEVRNLVGHGKAKAVLFEIFGGRTFELIEEVTVGTATGSSYGAWWGAPNGLPSIPAYNRNKRVVLSRDIRGLYSSLAVAAELIASTPGFSVQIYLFETKNVHQNDAVMCEVSVGGQRVFDFGVAYDLQFDRSVTRVWQLN